MAQELWILLAIVMLGLALRVGLLGRSGLWADEVFSLAIATGHSLEQPAAAAQPELGDFVELDHAVPAIEFSKYLKHEHPVESPARVIRAVLLSDTSPPLYYLLLYGWTRVFGTSDTALRGFSILCWLACLPFFVAVARRVAGREAVVASCVLFAFSPLAIYYSNEGRMYSLLWLCVLATTWASIVLHKRGGNVGVYTVWVLASAGGFLTHYFFFFPWLAMVGYLMINPEKLRRVHLLVSLALTGVLILPWYAKLPQSAANWRITQGWLKLYPGHFNRLAGSLDLVTQFFSGHAHELWLGNRASYIAALILFGIVFVLMIRRSRAELFRQDRLFLWLSFAAACLGPLAYDLVQHTYMAAKPRYAIAALPASYLLAAIGFACLRPRMVVTMLCLICLAWMPNILSIYRNPSPWLPMREIARAATVNGSPSDLVLVHSIPSGVLGIARYATGPAPIASWVEQLKNRRTPESLQQLAAGRTRILFVKVHDAGAPAPEEDWLRANAQVLHETKLGIGAVVEFQLKPRGRFGQLR